MLSTMKKFGWMVALAAMTIAPTIKAQQDNLDREDRQNDSENYQDRYDRNGSDVPMRVDRYLDVQVWPNRDDAEYYSGDNIVLNYRANRDCFVAIYSVDSRGQVNLLFPADPSDDNFVTGGVTYQLPGGNDKYDLKVNGPSGREQIQMIASRERFPIPNWYRNSGIYCDDNTNRDEFMDNLNDRNFVRYPGQRFALDRALIYVKEWEPEYYHPIYAPYYPDWAVCGNVYIDYPWGSSVYINGVYWGCAPLYIPRLVVGWHVVTVYDPYGGCWESDFHCSRYHTVVFDRTVIKTSRVIESRFPAVRVARWKDPIKSGYPDFKPMPNATKTPRGTITATPGTVDRTNHLGAVTDDNFTSLTKKYVRGDVKLVKTGRGFETEGDLNGIKPTRPNVAEGRDVRPSQGGAYRAKTQSDRPWGTPADKGVNRGGEVGNGSSAGETNSNQPDNATDNQRKVGHGAYGDQKQGGGSAQPGVSNPPQRRSGEKAKAAPKVQPKSGGDEAKTPASEKPRESNSGSSYRNSGEGGHSVHGGGKGRRP